MLSSSTLYFSHNIWEKRENAVTQHFLFFVQYFYTSSSKFQFFFQTKSGVIVMTVSWALAMVLVFAMAWQTLTLDMPLYYWRYVLGTLCSLYVSIEQPLSSREITFTAFFARIMPLLWPRFFHYTAPAAKSGTCIQCFCSALTVYQMTKF